MHRALSSIVLALATSCAASPPESFAESFSESQAPIIGGAPDSQVDGAVVLIRPGGGQCSGVALSKRLVLTAGHCLTGVDMFVRQAGLQSLPKR